MASKYFRDLIKSDPIIIKAVNKETLVENSVTVPAFKIFELPKSTSLKFHILDFHEYFDGIIGFDILVKLKAKINFINSTLETPNCCVGFNFTRANQPAICTMNASPHAATIVQIPVSIPNGDIIIPEQEING